MLGIPGLALLLLAALWSASRHASHETPRWDDRAFLALRLAPGAAPAWTERWVVAVHPACPHCRVSLGALAAARDHEAADVRVTALLVDVARAPADSAVARLPADETRWDAAQRWRRRWGHAIYGEVFCFDAAGALLRVLPPLADERAARRALAAAGIDGLPE